MVKNTIQKNKPQKVNKKETKEKRSKVGTFITFFFFILVIAGIVLGCLFTPTFDIDSVSVNDGINVTKEQVLSKVGNLEGMNIFRINKIKLEKEIESIPYVKNATVKRKLPSEINIDYEERVPYALLKYIESYIVVDKYGYILETIKELNENLPVIYGIDVENYKEGQVLSDEDEYKYENIVYLLETAQNAAFGYTINEIDSQDIDNIRISIKELEIEINYGKIDRTSLNEKVLYLKSVLKKLENKKGTVNISSSNYLEKTIFTEKY